MFVVETVERTSQSKSSVGSGFTVGGAGFIATNYHVVASALLKPDQYQLRTQHQDGSELEVEIAAVDPIHDLAVLRSLPLAQPDKATSTQVPNATPKRGLHFAALRPAVGDPLLALGNPLDIGLSLVPGTYNGNMKKDYRSRIHFTGALNPGMSGGPAVNTAGEVVGINVAGAGNSVGFLVPATHLEALISRAESGSQSLAEQKAQFGDMVRAHQAALVDDLLAGNWELQPFGPLKIPKEVRDYVNCTGAANELDADAKWRQSVSNCTVNDRVFLSRRLDTGPVEMYFAVYESDDLSAIQFANLFAGGTFSPNNRGSTDDLTTYDCVERWTRLPKLGEQRFKASYCLRAYLDYPDLYDVLYVARAMPSATQGLYVHYTLAGVGRESAQRFHDKLLGSLEWN